jgi:peptide-methionine (R)-S-oxide reductase
MAYHTEGHAFDFPGAHVSHSRIGAPFFRHRAALVSGGAAALLCVLSTTACSQDATVKAAPVSSTRTSTYVKPPDSELKKKLTPLQYAVTQRADTETPFNNEYWDNHDAGIYVDVVSGEVLFSSLDKYDSGTGWPSFTRPLVPSNITTKSDHLLGYTRTEVRSAGANSHLGHLFDDGPKPTGLRYCMNSAAMRFIPVSRLQAEGYGQYAALFKSTPAAAAATPRK